MAKPRSTLLLFLGLGVAGCAKSPQQTLALVEEAQISLVQAPLDQLLLYPVAVAGGAGRKTALLEVPERRLRTFDERGVQLAERYVPILVDGTPVEHIVYLGEQILGVSGRSGACVVLAEEVVTSTGCWLPLQMVRVADVEEDGRGVLIVASTKDEGPVLVRFDWNDGTFELDFKIELVREIENPLDSARVRWGLGFAAVGERRYAYADYNPPTLTLLDRNARVERRIRLGDARTAEETASVETDSLRILTDDFARTIGLVALRDGLLHAAYSPENDTTVLTQLTWDGSVVSRGGVPFRMDLKAGAGQVVYGLTYLNLVNLAIFRVEPESGGP